MYRMSETELSSYVGDVLPLRLCAVPEGGSPPLRAAWSVRGDCVHLRSFAGGEPDCFEDGVLLTLLSEGEAEVTAEAEGERYTCRVRVRPRRTEAPDAVLIPRPADLHTHTTTDHNHDRVAACGTQLAAALIESERESGAIRCGVISDHAAVTNRRLFFEGFCAARLHSDAALIVFAGSESEAHIIGYDRYGLQHKYGGEMVALNTDTFTYAENWPDFLDGFAKSPAVVGILSHPYVMGFSQRSIWDFRFHETVKQPGFVHAAKLIELDNGTNSSTRPLYQYAYSLALDAGLHLAPCCNSDNHGPYEPCPGKTMLLSSENSREMLLDALLARRVYACQSGAVALDWRVNGCRMGETLPALTEEYCFAVHTSLLREEPAAAPVRCEVISDGGLTVWDAPFDTAAEFTLHADSARYFYLRLTDAAGRFTWSAPVWTGRPPADTAALQRLVPLDKTGFTAYDAQRGCPAPELVCDDPLTVWDAGAPTATVTVDMGAVHTVCAVGHTAPPMHGVDPGAGDAIRDAAMSFALEYSIDAGTDGKEYTPCRRGIIRNFGGEELLTFAPVRARYIRFAVTGTVGRAVGGGCFDDAPVRIGELSVFTDPAPESGAPAFAAAQREE